MFEGHGRSFMFSTSETFSFPPTDSIEMDHGTIRGGCTCRTPKLLLVRCKPSICKQDHEGRSRPASVRSVRGHGPFDVWHAAPIRNSDMIRGYISGPGHRAGSLPVKLQTTQRLGWISPRRMIHLGCFSHCSVGYLERCCRSRPDWLLNHE